VTDHVALPLGWNRDNYWQVHFLTRVDTALERLVDAPTAESLRQSIRRVARGHLSWVFRRAERPHGHWHRSYLVTGKPKDGPLFQMDQQCYPLLELSEYCESYPRDTSFAREILGEGVVETVLEILLSKVDAGSGLVPTDESPGDDAMDYPFNFSNHILLWHTLSRLRAAVRSVGLEDAAREHRLLAAIDSLRSLTMHPDRFLVLHDEKKPVFAYVTDGRGKHTLYHDANDVPTCFAMQWGLPLSYYEAWQNTMQFALSPSNGRGYCSKGDFRGLGSVHSAGAWPLGYFHELRYAHLTGEQRMQADAWRRIAGSMQWDGTFPEAVDPETGKCSSKAWFSWPGAVIGSALVEFLLAGDESVNGAPATHVLGNT